MYLRDVVLDYNRDGAFVKIVLKQNQDYLSVRCDPGSQPEIIYLREVVLDHY